MNKLFTDIEIIDRYLRDQSKGDEKDIVKIRLATDAKFRRLFDDIELMIQGIKETAIHTSREEKLIHLRNFYNEAYESSEDDILDDDDEEGGDEKTFGSSSEDYEEPTPGSGLGKSKVISFPAADVLRQYKVAVAAAVTLLIAAWYLIFQMNPITNEELFAENFIPFSNLDNNKRSTNEVLSERKQAYTAYDQGDYEQAALLFEKVITTSDNQLLDMFYLGNAYLAIGNAENAIKNFKAVIKSETGLTTVAKWYLGLCYLKAEQTDLAREMLLEVQNSGDERSEKATVILRKLDKNDFNKN